MLCSPAMGKIKCVRRSRTWFWNNAVSLIIAFLFGWLVWFGFFLGGGWQFSQFSVLVLNFCSMVNAENRSAFSAYFLKSTREMEAITYKAFS